MMAKDVQRDSHLPHSIACSRMRWVGVLRSISMAAASASFEDRDFGATAQHIYWPVNMDQGRQYDEDKGSLTRLSFTVLYLEPDCRDAVFAQQ